MLLKSFYRKRTTKIYLIIFTLIFLALYMVIFGKSYYRKYINESFEGSYITFTLSKDKDFPKLEGVTNLQEVVNLDNYFLLSNSSFNLDNYEILISPFYNDSKMMEAVQERLAKLGIDTSLYNFEFSDEVYTNNFFYANPFTYTILDNQINSNDNTYVGKLYDWIDFEEFISELEGELGTEIDCLIMADAMQYIDIYHGFNIFLYLLLFLFVILSIISIVNVLIDEKKTNFLYRIIGYSNKHKRLIVISKLLSLLVFSLLLGTISSLILKVIFKW